MEESQLAYICEMSAVEHVGRFPLKLPAQAAAKEGCHGTDCLAEQATSSFALRQLELLEEESGLFGARLQEELLEAEGPAGHWLWRSKSFLG